MLRAGLIALARFSVAKRKPCDGDCTAVEVTLAANGTWGRAKTAPRAPRAGLYSPRACGPDRRGYTRPGRPIDRERQRPPVSIARVE